MQSIELSISFAAIMGGIGAVAGGYIVWSAKKLLTNIENSVGEVKDYLDEHEDRLSKHEICLARIVTHHDCNHGQRIECGK